MRSVVSYLAAAIMSVAILGTNTFALAETCEFCKHLKMLKDYHHTDKKALTEAEQALVEFSLLGFTGAWSRFPSKPGYAIKIVSITPGGTIAAADSKTVQDRKIEPGDYIAVTRDNPTIFADKPTIAVHPSTNFPAAYLLVERHVADGMPSDRPLGFFVSRFRAGLNPMDARTDADVVFFEDRFSLNLDLTKEAIEKLKADYSQRPLKGEPPFYYSQDRPEDLARSYYGDRNTASRPVTATNPPSTAGIIAGVAAAALAAAILLPSNPRTKTLPDGRVCTWTKVFVGSPRPTNTFMGDNPCHRGDFGSPYGCYDWDWKCP